MALPLTMSGIWRTEQARPGDLPCHDNLTVDFNSYVVNGKLPVSY
jgi:hypothetical protein